MRVLHVIWSIDPRIGGPFAALHGLATAQAAAGLQVTVAATWVEGEQLDGVAPWERAGVAVHLIGPATGPLRRHRQLEPSIDRLVSQADIVHVHAVWEEIQHCAARSARRQSVPYVVRPCGMLDPWSLAQKSLKKRAYLRWRLRQNLAQAAAIHFTSLAERDNSSPLCPATPALVEPNGVDLQQMDLQHEMAGAQGDATAGLRQRFPHLAGMKIIAFMGRIHPCKGLDLLIPAFALLPSDKVALVLIGPGEDVYRAKLENMIRHYRVQDRVVFTGMLRGAERDRALGSADLFALPSHHENFCNAVIESLAAGTPVIVSDKVNIHREIAEGGVGDVVPLNTGALAAKLARRLENDHLRLAAAARARPFIQSHYQWKTIAARWTEHYARLIAENGAARLGAAKSLEVS